MNQEPIVTCIGCEDPEISAGARETTLHAAYMLASIDEPTETPDQQKPSRQVYNMRDIGYRLAAG